MSGLKSRIEDFLTHEAALLDDKRFDEWLELYDEDAHYWAPVLPDAAERGECMAHFDEERSFMEARIQRLSLPNAYSEHPPSRTCRIISNIQVVDEDRDGDGNVQVRANLIVHEFRMRVTGEPTRALYAGAVRYTLRPKGEAFRIHAKRIDLIDSEGAFYLSSIPL
ncbi:MAG: aromatic-ring-hydroxylating dioxygenase subunit beta [Sphingomonadales bacterium]|nr:aromatic-ring-hydroxylating dioxygenase subunit beta [Sphingomonadales bacterium]